MLLMSNPAYEIIITIIIIIIIMACLYKNPPLHGF